MPTKVGEGQGRGSARGCGPSEGISVILPWVGATGSLQRRDLCSLASLCESFLVRTQSLYLEYLKIFAINGCITMLRKEKRKG